MVGLIGLEPMTPALSRRCSNQLSYRPVGIKKFGVQSVECGIREFLPFRIRHSSFRISSKWWRLTDSNR